MKYALAITCQGTDNKVNLYGLMKYADRSGILNMEISNVHYMPF
jgi:hypothetical protein